MHAATKLVAATGNARTAREAKLPLRDWLLLPLLSLLTIGILYCDSGEVTLMKVVHAGFTRETASDDSAADGQWKLPMRDWILLPLLSLLTICLTAGCTEFIARRAFAVSKTSIAAGCMMGDSLTGRRIIPNSVCWEKTGESRLTEYRFNNCGHRTGMECGPKPPGTYRIVMVGSSIAMGAWVPREKTFAALLPMELSRRTGRKIELYNESIAAETPNANALRFDDVLAVEPDLILWVITPWDVQNRRLECRKKENRYG
jgi:hypothetical protein